MSKQGGRPPEESDHFYFRMDALLSEDPSQGKRGAARKVAEQFGIKVDEQFLDRAPRRYTKLKREGLLSGEEPLPPGVAAGIEERFRLRERLIAEAEINLEQVEAEAKAIGLDLPEDLHQVASALRREIEDLDQITSPTGHELQIYGLTYGIRTREEAFEKFRQAGKRIKKARRELEIVERARKARHILRELGSYR